MSIWKKNLLSASLIIVVLSLCGSFYHFVKISNINRNLAESALFISEPLWNFDIEMMEGYLQNTMENNNYKELSIYDDNEDLFVNLKLGEQSEGLLILEKLNLIPEINFKEDIIRNEIIIGKVEVIWMDDSIFFYSYLFIPGLLLFIISYLYMNILKAKQSLENQFLELKKQKDYIEEIFNIVPEGLVTLDSEKRSRGNNRSFDEIIAYWSEITQWPFNDTKKHFIDQLAEKSLISSSGQDSIIIEQHTINIEFTTAEIPSIDDVTKLVSLRDISKLVSMERQLAQAQKLEAVGRLAAGIAHEINTPVQYVLSNTDFLIESSKDISQLINSLEHISSGPEGSFILTQENLHKQIKEIDWEYLKEEIPDALRQAKEGMQRISKIVTAMKHFSHPSGEVPELNDINSALENTVSISSSEWRLIAEVELNLDPSLPAVPCFLDQLNQVILIMIVNSAHAIAHKFEESTELKGKISFKTIHQDNNISIIIRDNGAGMSESVKAKVFDPFFTTKEVNKGTGQGLAIAHDVIVKNHSGTITVESEKDVGTSFTITLPCEREDHVT